MNDDDPTTGFDTDNDSDLPSPSIGSLLSGFRLDRVLGEGGQGVVYKAHDLAADRDVALKLVNNLSPSKCEALLNEARQAAKLRHENIIPLFYVTPATFDPVFIVMEYVDGVSLAEIIRTEAPLPEAAALAVIRDVAAGLEHAHSAGIVHLDVKPANVLIERATGRARLSDFGLAIHHSERWSCQSGGTLAYMAPEQVERRTEQFDGRTDIWAVGVLLYEMLTARRPFGEACLESQLVEEIISLHPKPPSQWNPTVSPRSDVICLRCLEKDITRRFPSAARLLDEVETARSGQPVSQNESQSREESVTTASSKPAIAIGGCLVAIAAGICVLLVLFGVIEADEMKRIIQRSMEALIHRR